MALRKILTKRLISDARGAKSPPSIPLRREHLTSPDSDEKGFFLRFLHRRALGHSAARLPEFLSLPIGEKIRETLRGRDIAGDRLCIGLLSPPPPPPSKIGDSLFGLSVSDAKKILRLAHMEKLKSKLRETSESSIPYSEFSRICVEACENEEQGDEFAKMLDQSGNVIVLGNVVFLRPEQVAKSMEAIISQSIDNPNDPRRKELEKLEKQKAIIDEKAREQVKGELYCGLGFVLVQTLAAMRLTFWELSWDVMEPICFFVTSVHFALGYGFFLKTSTEPTFQGYFQRRFQAKQKRLMALANFDFQRYTHLCKVLENHHRERKGQSLSAINQYC